MAILKHPIEQIPIPHGSRTNLLLNPAFLMNYFLVPYGAILLALPFVLWVGSRHRRLRPLLLGFWAAFILGLGGTTPLPKLILRRAFEVLTFERFTLLAAFLVLPLLGLVAERAVERLRWKAVGVFAVGAVMTITMPFIWMVYSPFHATGALNVDSVLNFLNHDGHDRYRYITLGFGNSVPKISTYTDATSVDGEYNSARLLPELTHYGSAQLTNSKFFGTAGMESLRAMLMHANHYGLKYIFVHDPYYEPLLAFAGWRKIETYDSGSIGVWSKDDVPPAQTDCFGRDSLPLAGPDVGNASRWPAASWRSCCWCSYRDASRKSSPLVELPNRRKQLCTLARCAHEPPSGFWHSGYHDGLGGAGLDAVWRRGTAPAAGGANSGGGGAPVADRPRIMIGTRRTRGWQMPPTSTKVR